MGETRKLAAILVADVVGYSRLAGADEEGRSRGLRALRSDLIDPAIAPTTAASSSAPATARSSNFAAWSTRSAAPSKCRTAWSSATRACRPSVASNSASAFISATWSRRATAISWATASISRRGWKGSPSRAESVLSEAAYRASARPGEGGVRRSRREDAQEHRAAGTGLCAEVGAATPATAANVAPKSASRRASRIVVLPFANIGGDPSRNISSTA